MTRDELHRRQADYERVRWIGGAIGAVPLLSVYFLVHTPWLRAFLPDSKFLSALVLICVPLGWLFGVSRLHRAWGVRHFGLRCPRCDAALLEGGVRRGRDRDTCRACGAEFDALEGPLPEA